MADLEWNGYEDEVTGEWISNLVVVYDPAMSKMPKQRWHRALNKINKVKTQILYNIICPEIIRLTNEIYIYFQYRNKVSEYIQEAFSLIYNIILIS